jgi:hypothetical protein
VLADLGRGAGRLLAEYDAENDTIRVNASAVERVRAALGDEEARTFVRCALAHEAYHREYPGGSEDQARAFVRRSCGIDPSRYEALLR